MGDGAKIKLWEDPWLSLDTPTKPMGPATRETASLCVKDLLRNDTGEWDRHQIRAIIPFEEERVLSLQPSLKGAPDVLKWLGTKTGIYSVKSGYHIARAERQEEILEEEDTAEFDWKKTVWDLKLAPKVKVFTWKSLKGILPVGERLLQRHINVDPKCKRCGASESINHLLFHCPFAREVWSLSPMDSSFEVSGLTDLRADWNVLHSQKCLPPTGINQTPLIPWIMWSLWKARNKLVFEKWTGNPVEMVTQAIVAAREWSAAQGKEVKRPMPGSLAPSVRVKVVARSDASWSSNKMTPGLGWWVMEGELSTKGQRDVSYVASALIAEGMALREAVLACRRAGIKEVRLESDSVQIIKAINLREPPLEIYGIVEDIRLMAEDFDVVVFAWISRERNVESDLLAKNALCLYEQEVGEAGLMPPPN